MAGEEENNTGTKCVCKRCTWFVVLFAIILVILIVLIVLLSVYHYDDVILPVLIKLKIKKEIVIPPVLPSSPTVTV